MRVFSVKEEALRVIFQLEGDSLAVPGRASLYQLEESLDGPEVVYFFDFGHWRTLSQVNNAARHEAVALVWPSL